MIPTNWPGQKLVLPNNADAFLPLVLTSAAAFTLLWRLGDGSLAAWDEAIYAQVSKETARGGDWLTLHWEYQPWFEKPPLFMWATALLYRLFGVSEFGARAASAFSGIGLVLVTYATGKLVWNKEVGFLSAVVLLTCYHFLSFSRFGTMEIMLTLFTYLALYSYLRLRDGNRRWWTPVWVSCALALMVKGAGGAVAPVVIILALILDKQFIAEIRSRYFWQGVLLALVVVVPWHAAMYAWYGRSFLDEYVGYHVAARATRTLEGHPSTYLYYVGKLVDGFFPWCLLVPFAVVSGVRRVLQGEARPQVFLLLGALVFGLYTLIPTRRPWYIVPLYPALAILVAAFVVNLYHSSRARPLRRRLVAAACVIMVVTGGVYSSLSLYLNHKREEPLARLARLARPAGADDRDSLVLFSESEPFHEQVPLFYSDRPVQQTYSAVEPAVESASRYVSFENLVDVVRHSTKQIILRKEDAARLAAGYDIEVRAEADSLIYAVIRRK